MYARAVPCDGSLHRRKLHGDQEKFRDQQKEQCKEVERTEIRPEGLRFCRARDESNEEGQAQERTQRKESNQPEAGNCHRAVRGKKVRRKGAVAQKVEFCEEVVRKKGSGKKERCEEKECGEEVVSEEVASEEEIVEAVTYSLLAGEEDGVVAGALLALSPEEAVFFSPEPPFLDWSAEDSALEDADRDEPFPA